MVYIVGQEIEGDVPCSCTRGRFRQLVLASAPGFVGTVQYCESCKSHQLIVFSIDNEANLSLAGVFRLTGRNVPSLTFALSRIRGITHEQIAFMVAVAEQNTAAVVV